MPSRTSASSSITTMSLSRAGLAIASRVAGASTVRRTAANGTDYGEARALAWLRHELDRVAEQAAQAVDDGQAEPQSGPLTGKRRVDLVELAEDAAMLALDDADAAVPHLDTHAVAAATAADDDATARGVAYGVRHEVEQDA